MNEDNFFLWLLDNECQFKHEKLFPFIQNCIDNFDFFSLNTEQEIYNYLWVNGFSEEIILSFLRLWKVFEESKKLATVNN